MTDSLDLRWVAETIAKPPPEPPTLVQGLLRRGELCVLGAPRALGKSWWAMNLGALVARGSGFFMGTLPVHRSATVLYCNGELDPWASGQRWQMLLGSEVPGPIAETFEPWRLRVVQMRSTSASEVGATTEQWFEGMLDARVASVVEAHDVGLLILDPWATFYSGDENSNDQVESALGQLRALALRHGVAIVIVHHLSKATDARDPEDLWRGASRLADWASTRVTLLPHFTERSGLEAGLTAVEARRYVDVRFLRRYEPTEPFSAVLGYDGWWCRWEPAEGHRPVGRLTPADVAAACKRSGGSWASTTEARSALGIGREAAAKALRQAVDAGVIVEAPGRNGAKAYRLPEVVEASHDWPQQVLDLAAERERRSQP